MYENFWGLSESPFQNRVDVRWFYESPIHEEALARLFFLVEQRRRFGMVTGPAGTGKSVLLHVLNWQLKRTQRQSVVLDPAGMSGHELLWQLAANLRLGPSESDQPLVLWRSIQDHLAGLQMARMQLVVLFDHLDRAESDCLQVIERLIQLDAAAAPCVTFLSASRSPELSNSLPILAELSDLRIELGPLDLEHTAGYINHLLKLAGCQRTVFEPPALAGLYELTEGIPRDINRLCDLSLLAATAEHQRTVTAAIVDGAAEELQMRLPLADAVPQMRNRA